MNGLFSSNTVNLNRLSKGIRTGIFIVLVMTIIVFGQMNTVWANGDETLNTSYESYGHVGVVSEGTGLRDVVLGEIVLNVPGTIVQAWLYWGGYDYIPGGDNTASLSVDGADPDVITGNLINDPNNCWWWGSFYGYIYRADVSQWVETGTHTYAVSDITFVNGAAILQGASLLVVYEDPNLPLQNIEIKDGYDGIWHNYEPPRGPNSEVVTFLFDSQPVERDVECTFIVGGVDNNGSAGIRTNALWYSFGSETPPTELVDQPYATDYGGSSTNPPASFNINPFYDADGKEWDDTTIELNVPASATYMCVQLESEDSWFYENQQYRAASMLFFGAAQVMAGRGCIGDYVWKDNNGDGNQDLDESGLDGVTIYLIDINESILTTTTTGDNPATPEIESGWYNFTGLQAGPYHIDIDLSTVPVEYQMTWGSLPYVIELDVGEDYAEADYGFQPPVFDFGDAEDSPYPSLLASNGARHGLSTFYFGTGVTYEEDSNQPNADQMDDGIVLLGSTAISGGYYRLPLLPGEYAAVRVTCGGTAEESVYIHGWIDWDQDGEWEDVDENILCSVPFQVPSVDTIEFMVPDQVQPGSLWARFRIDDQALNAPLGEAAHGEVEDYFWQDIIVAVELTSFQATTNIGNVTLEWTTQSETDNLGFNVYRANTATGPYVKINTEIIAGQGTSEIVSHYSYVDDTIEPETVYFYKITDVSYQGYETMHGPIAASAAAAPEDYRLEQNYPNPFNPETLICYSIKTDGHVRLEIYNLVGQRIRTLINKSQNAGNYELKWNGKDDKGNLSPSGIYICKLTAKEVELSMRMTFMR